jgi:signal transduction histidine kinase
VTIVSESKAIHVLYMEDDPGLAHFVRKTLEREGFIVDVAQDGQEGLALYAPGTHDVVLVDQVMPGLDGLGVIRSLAEGGSLPPTIMITGAGDETIAVEAMKLGARDYIVKDVVGGFFRLLPSVIKQVLEQQRLADEKSQAETERDAMLEELSQYAADLETRNKELDAFAHTVAHDLRGPLSLSIGFCTLLREEWPDLSVEQVEEALQMVIEGAHKMHNIIDELLMLASVRKEEVKATQLDMGHILAEAEKRLAYLVNDYQPHIVGPDTWPAALGHGPWVEEVWTNYISNAIKYGGQPPRVELGATLQSDDMVRFWVRDNGPGLTPEEQVRLFTLFTRLDQVRAKGHGLGLSIVRRIVEKLGGQVGVESQVGSGSVFTFTLPAVFADSDRKSQDNGQ